MTLLLMALCLLTGGVRAADSDIMAMRGESPDGKAEMNQVHFHPSDEASMRLGAAVRTAEPSERKSEYVGWKDVCVRMPKIIAGQFVEFNAPGSFVLAQPLMRVPEFDDNSYSGFFGDLVKEEQSP